jgi:glucokinase
MSLYLGLDIGGTKIAGGLVTGEGRVVSSDRCPTPLTGGAAILGAALGLARTLRDAAPERVVAIGIGTGGQVDTERGVIISATSLLPGWAGTEVKASFERVFGLPCFVDNDVNALAVGEARFGAGRGLPTVLYLALGTGVGGALLLGGCVHHGATWTGGEFGHLLLTTDEAAPRKTLEDWASGPGLVQTYREMTRAGPEVTGEAVAAEAARDPDGPAARAVTRTGECLGFGLAGLANALDPDLIVLGGGLAALGDALLDPARRILRRHALPGPARCPVVPAALGPDAAVIGAAALGMEPTPA